MDNLSAATIPPLSYHQMPSSSSSTSSEQQPKNVKSSINSCSSSSANQNQIDRESISDSKIRSNKKLLNNNGNKKSNNDLVTIVTISGFIDENENKRNINEMSSNAATMATNEEVSMLAHL